MKCHYASSCLHWTTVNPMLLYYAIQSILHRLIKSVSSEVITCNPSFQTNIIINITWHYIYSKLEKFTVSTDIGTREKISTETMWQPF